MRGRGAYDPAAPRLALAIAPAPNLPPIVRDVIGRARLIYERPQRFPEITGERYAPGSKLRERRGSRLEAIALTVAALAVYWDRRTMRVGVPAEGGLCDGISIKRLCEMTGLSRPRQIRALGELEGDLIRSHQRVEEYYHREAREFRYRGCPAIRVLSPTLLERLGIGAAKLRKSRDRAAADWKAAHAAPASAAALLEARAAGRRRRRGSLSPFAARRRAERTARTQHELELQEANDQRRKIALMVELALEHPDWGPDRCRLEADRRLRG